MPSGPLLVYAITRWQDLSTLDWTSALYCFHPRNGVPRLVRERVRTGFFFFQAEDGIRDHCVTGVQTCALPISAVGCGDVMQHARRRLVDRLEARAAETKREIDILEIAAKRLGEQADTVEGGPAVKTAGCTRAEDREIGRASCRERV